MGTSKGLSIPCTVLSASEFRPWYVTTSSICGGVLDAIGVYVMRTLRFFFHMGSVECVTFHEPDSHDNWGGEIEAEDSVAGSEDGARRVTMASAGQYEWLEVVLAVTV